MEDCKPCSVCKQILELSNFHNKTSAKSGKASACKSCSSIQKAAGYRRNIEHNRLYHKVNYQKNKEAIKAKASEWAKNNPKQQYARNRRWLLSQPGKANDYSHKRRARLKNAESYPIRNSFLAKLYSSPCLYCGSNIQITADHIIPLELGGRHCEGNLVPACQSCNSSKGILLLSVWKAKRATPKRDPF